MQDIPERAVPEPVTRRTAEDYLKLQGLMDKVSPEVVERFANLAIRYQLNPFLRELHLVPSDGKTVAVVGYEVYLRKAERTGRLDGWRVWTEGEGESLKAVLEIYRHDWAHPFVHEVHLCEAIQTNDRGEPTGFWQRMPRFQLRKVAMAQGFRLAFPDELGGIPYEPAELNLNQVESGPAPKAEPQVPSSQTTPGKTVFSELNEYLSANGEAFTKKHLGWIRDQLEKTPTAEKAKAMLGYARKIVLQGGDPPEQARQSRTYYNRTRVKAQPTPDPVF